MRWKEGNFLAKRTHIGIFSLRERARILGGEKSISDEKRVAALTHQESIVFDTTRVSFRQSIFFF